MSRHSCIVGLLLVLTGCTQQRYIAPEISHNNDTLLSSSFAGVAPLPAGRDSAMASRIVAFAKTQIGVPYRYCSMTPDRGFDCSGFVNYVFNNFNIKVPRSSVDFTNFGQDVPLSQSQPGDLILFTGTDPRSGRVGHIGIITTNDSGNISFIQSTSGAAYGVVISPLDDNYKQRFVKVIRVLN